MSEQKTDQSKSLQGQQQRRHLILAISLGAFVAGMVGMSYAAVPLYQIFCQVTGYGGTTQRAESAPTQILDKIIEVRFDANTARGLPWKFRPAQKTIEIKIGESALVHYEAENNSDKEVVGTATFNVTPETAGVYFNKIECFCFTEQVLKPGERVDMPVTFFIDPEIAKDPEAKHIKEITLSYTFFPKKKENSSGVVSSRPQKETAEQGS